ncbi:MAG: hypothetical protein IPJ69_14735 [Deltaproteobacteria bacterium]|nr:MAG: hypothetical protein IPJ69_14735 [Deltaproteobacteria bacterium]
MNTKNIVPAITKDTPRLILQVSKDKSAASQNVIIIKSNDPCILTQWNDMLIGKVRSGTICLPMSESSYLPPPQLSPPLTTDQPNLLSQEEIQKMWNDTLFASTNQNIANTSQELARKEDEKAKKLETILMVALKSGNLDMAVLLISGLETSRANAITAGLLGRVEALQEQRKVISQQMSNLGNGGQDAQKVSGMNLQASNIATEISLLQTFLQEVSSQKQEAQQLSSNFIKSRHDSAMGIIRNIA